MENAAGEEEDYLDLSGRFWTQDDMGETVWMTDFPPPPGFTGDESRPYDEDQDLEPYERACTPEEVATLEADQARARAAERAEEEELRDAWLAMLRGEAEEIEPGSAAEQPAG